MRKRLITVKIALLMSVGIFCFGCDKKEPMLLFNSQPITSRTIAFCSKNFALNEPVNYVLLNPKGFQSPYLRVQIIKKDTKVQNWGAKVHLAKDVKIDASKNFYINDVTLTQSGLYIMSIYYLDDLDKPIARGEFWVK